MALSRRTVIGQIEIQRDGTVGVRMEKQIVDGDVVISAQYHRTAINPGDDVAKQLGNVNAHLTQMGEAVMDVAEMERVSRVCKLEHTPEIVAAKAAARASAAAARN